MCSVERNKKEYTKAILGSLGLVGEAYQVKSVGVARFLSLINRHLVIHHIASRENLMGDHYAATTAGQFSPACNPACSTNFAGYDCMTVSEFILLS